LQEDRGAVVVVPVHWQGARRVRSPVAFVATCLISPGWVKAHNEGRQPQVVPVVESPVRGIPARRGSGRNQPAKLSSQSQPNHESVRGS